MSWGSFWHSVGGGISKAFGVITSPIRWAGGIIKDSVHAVTLLPAQIVQGVTKIAGKVNDTFKNVVNHVADDVKDLGGKVADDASSMLKVPLMIAAAGLAAMLVMRGPP